MSFTYFLVYLFNNCLLFILLADASAGVSTMSQKRRVFDGTSEKELIKAMSTYLNKTGAGDYNLPCRIGESQPQSNKRNDPNWSF